MLWTGLCRAYIENNNDTIAKSGAVHFVIDSTKTIGMCYERYRIAFSNGVRLLIPGVCVLVGAFLLSLALTLLGLFVFFIFTVRGPSPVDGAFI